MFGKSADRDEQEMGRQEPLRAETTFTLAEGDKGVEVNIVFPGER